MDPLAGTELPSWVVSNTTRRREFNNAPKPRPAFPVAFAPVPPSVVSTRNHFLAMEAIVTGQAALLPWLMPRTPVSAPQPAAPSAGHTTALGHARPGTPVMQGTHGPQGTPTPTPTPTTTGRKRPRFHIDTIDYETPLPPSRLLSTIPVLSAPRTRVAVAAPTVELPLTSAPDVVMTTPVLDVNGHVDALTPERPVTESLSPVHSVPSVTSVPPVVVGTPVPSVPSVPNVDTPVPEISSLDRLIDSIVSDAPMSVMPPIGQLSTVPVLSAPNMCAGGTASSGGFGGIGGTGSSAVSGGSEGTVADTATFLQPPEIPSVYTTQDDLMGEMQTQLEAPARTLRDPRFRNRSWPDVLTHRHVGFVGDPEHVQVAVRWYTKRPTVGLLVCGPAGCGKMTLLGLLIEHYGLRTVVFTPEMTTRDELTLFFGNLQRIDDRRLVVLIPHADFMSSEAQRALNLALAQTRPHQRVCVLATSEHPLSSPMSTYFTAVTLPAFTDSAMTFALASRVWKVVEASEMAPVSDTSGTPCTSDRSQQQPVPMPSESALHAVMTACNGDARQFLYRLQALYQSRGAARVAAIFAQSAQQKPVDVLKQVQALMGSEWSREHPSLPRSAPPRPLQCALDLLHESGEYPWLVHLLYQKMGARFYVDNALTSKRVDLARFMHMMSNVSRYTVWPRADHEVTLVCTFVLRNLHFFNQLYEKLLHYQQRPSIWTAPYGPSWLMVQSRETARNTKSTATTALRTQCLREQLTLHWTDDQWTVVFGAAGAGAAATTGAAGAATDVDTPVTTTVTTDVHTGPPMHSVLPVVDYRLLRLPTMQNWLSRHTSTDLVTFFTSTMRQFPDTKRYTSLTRVLLSYGMRSVAANAKALTVYTYSTTPRPATFGASTVSLGNKSAVDVHLAAVAALFTQLESAAKYEHGVGGKKKAARARRPAVGLLSSAVVTKKTK